MKCKYWVYNICNRHNAYRQEKYCRTLPFNLRENIYTSPSFRSIIRVRRKIERERAYTQQERKHRKKEKVREKENVRVRERDR